ncbi:MAG: hypothetical protein GX877_06270 [Bacteroidales bacterium]|nr:hypothetical protein [Bacteroidales bacterium]
MKHNENELETTDVYVTPTLQVTDVIIEENVLSGGSTGGFFKDLSGEEW